MNKPILTVMPDYGGGPYLWLIENSTPDCSLVGGNIGSDGYWASEPSLSHVTQELREDFEDWVTQFGLYAELPHFKWEWFHQRGLILAQRLKNQVGDKFIVRYVKPCEDPNHEQDRTTIIEMTFTDQSDGKRAGLKRRK